MARKKLVYYYDTETCTYEPAQITLSKTLKKSGIVLALALCGVLGIYFGAGEQLNAFRNAGMIQEKQELLSELSEVNGKLSAYNADLQALYAKDNGLYLPIVDGEQISENRWKVGRGGSPLYNRTTSDEARKTWVRIETLRKQMEMLRSSLTLAHARADLKDEELNNMPSILPVNGTLISGFGNRRHPVSGTIKFHDGLDFACGIGTPLYASANGTISAAGYSEHGYGKNVNIDHGNGYETKYAHMSEIIVQEGQKVRRGQLVGYSGNTGLSTGPHLHYEIKKNGEKIDPIEFFYQDLSPQEYVRLKLDKNTVTQEALRKKLDAPAMD